MNKKKSLALLIALFTFMFITVAAYAQSYTTAFPTKYNGEWAVRYELKIDTYRKLVSIQYGGSRSWRNNNPGNLKYGDFAKQNGAIGHDLVAGRDGDFAIFPDYATGNNAKKTLITTTYYSYTIQTMMEKYAPRSENNTDAYIAFIVNRTGMSKNTYISSMSNSQLESLIDAMKVYEGYSVGTVYTYVEG